MEGVPKAGVVFASYGNKLETGVDFRQELSNMMTFHTEKSASRKRSKREVVKMPPIMAPMYDIKVEIFYFRYFFMILYRLPQLSILE